MALLTRLRPSAQPLLVRLRLLASRRAYGSAAAAQLDYEYNYYSDEEEELQKNKNRKGMQEEGGETVGRGPQWVSIGDPVARRHMYAERLAKVLDVPHISMGNLVRQELQAQSLLRKQISGIVNQGKLVPEDIIFGLLSKRLEEGYSMGETGFVLDGIPRTRIQAEILDQIADIDLVLNLKCTECLVNNSLGNGIYTPSQECLSSQPQNIPLDPSVSGRDVIRKEKFRLYAEQRRPLEEYYKKQHKLIDFQVSGAPGETWRGLLAVLHLQDANDASPGIKSSHKLTA